MSLIKLIENVSGFLDEVRSAKKDNIKQGEKSDLIFRGQKAKDKLKPSLLRYLHFLKKQR